MFASVVRIMVLGLLLAWGTLAGRVQAVDSPSAAGPTSPEEESQAFDTLTVRGKVGWLAERLQQRFGVRSVPEARDRIVALETESGDVLPLFEDVRGRAFRRDPRLRDREVELLARRYHGSPFLHVIRVFAVEADGRYELDYWCDICSITMFELKDCECCQGPIELRRRRVEATSP